MPCIASTGLLSLLGGKPVSTLPKGGKTREVPLPEPVALALAEHLAKHPPVDGCVFSTREGTRVIRNYYNTHVWKPALVAVGVEPTRANGMHALRHWFASVQLGERHQHPRRGRVPRALRSRLHAAHVHAPNAVFGGPRPRQAIETALDNLADSPRTAEASEG